MPAEIGPKKQGRILVLRALDYKKKEIADELDINRHTVRHYLEQAHDEAEKTGKAEEVLLGSIFKGLEYDSPSKLGEAFSDLARQSTGTRSKVFYTALDGPPLPAPESVDIAASPAYDDDYDPDAGGVRTPVYTIPVPEDVSEIETLGMIALAPEQEEYAADTITYIAGREVNHAYPRFIDKDSHSSDTYTLHLPAEWTVLEGEDKTDSWHATDTLCVEISPHLRDEPLRVYREDDYKYRLEELWKNGKTPYRPPQRFDDID